MFGDHPRLARILGTHAARILPGDELASTIARGASIGERTLNLFSLPSG
jgi:hypothetical protein